MNVNEFAEQIVFGKTLEDKLLIPGKLTEGARDSSLPNVRSLRSPGRPTGLKMWHGDNAKVQPPSDDKLEHEQARGQLLHFLANHELLATELMALVLLKFPDAPHSFRRGILVTLQEEQEHTRMYIRRMKACGVEFGSYPLNGQFWRMVEPMQSPMDFVARLSLTFEQANLDYSLHFANVFRRIGDLATADVLQQIYEDEIGHVQHGLHWFRQWKNPEQDDWEAYQGLLEFPMSPQRGLGPRGAFNRDGRIRAGLTNDFIDAIEVFRQSRGRAPTVRWFDPSPESELARKELGVRDARLMEQLGKDLELLMVPVAKQDDIVLVRQIPSRAIRKSMKDAGLDLPQFVLISERRSLRDRKLKEFAPWAWTPKNHEIAQPLVASAQDCPPVWHPQNDDLYRKSWGAAKLRNWLESKAQDELPNWFAPAECTAIPVYQLDDIQAALIEVGQRGFSTAIFKQDLASSGRGQRRLDCKQPLKPEDLAWIKSRVAASSQPIGDSQPEPMPPVGIVEPELDRLVDLSFLWFLPENSDTPKFLGWTQPLTTDGRCYIGTQLGNALSTCEERVKRFVLADRGARLHRVVQWLESWVTPELVDRKFGGYFGIDAMVYQTPGGDLGLKPLVELNPRMTMGHIALGLKKRLASGVPAEFRILTKQQWQLVHEPLSDIPLERMKDGRWKSGVVWLNDVDNDTILVPTLLIGAATLGRFKTLVDRSSFDSKIPIDRFESTP